MKYWLFYLVKSSMEIAFRVFFKSLHFDGIENIPKNKPILFVANHAGSFLDGGMLEYTNRLKVFSLARGDAFNKPLPNHLLRSMLLLPIYRARDADAEKARKGNERTYDEVYELFRNNNRVLIFPEANSFPEKTLRQLKKGSANMVADMVLRSEGEMDLYVVPTGINYSHFGSYRIRTQVNYGKAIHAQDYLEQIKADHRKFGRDFTEVIEEELKKVVVKTAGEQEEDKEFVHHIAFNEFDDQNRYRQYDTGSAAIPAMVDAVTPETKPLIDAYEEALRKAGVKDRNVASGTMNFWAIFLAFSTIAVSLPAALLYRLFWLIAKKNAGKIIKNVLFYDSLHFGLGLIGSYLWVLILALTTYLVLPDSWTVLWQTLALIAAIVATPAWFIAVEELQHFYYELRFYSLGRERMKSLRELRSKLIDSLKS